MSFFRLMSARLNPIRIGDTLIRTYRLYNPLPENEWADPNIPEADEDNPINLTGCTVEWHLRNDGATLTYGTGTGVTVTPLTGTVAIEIETDVTETWVRDRTGNSYLNIIDTASNETSKCHQREVVLRQDEN